MNGLELVPLEDGFDVPVDGGVTEEFETEDKSLVLWLTWNGLHASIYLHLAGFNYLVAAISDPHAAGITFRVVRHMIQNEMLQEVPDHA